MLRTERMVKLTVVGPKNRLEDVVEVLHELGAVHIKEYTREHDFFDIGRPFERAETISRMLLKLRTTISMLEAIVSGEIHSKRVKKFGNIKDLETYVDAVLSKANELQEERERVKRRTEEIEAVLGLIDTIKSLNLPLEAFSDYASLEWRVGRVKNLDGLRTGLSRIERCEIYAGGKEKKSNEWIIALFFEKDQSERVAEILKECGFNEVDVSALVGFKGMPENVKRQLEDELKKLSGELSGIEREMGRLFRKSMATLRYWEEQLVAEAEKAEAPLKFGVSDNAFMITGWMPKREMKNLKNRLEQITYGKIFIKFEEVNERKENAPVKMSHPKPVNQFQYLMKMYSLPKYSEIDPTFFVFLTFPVFFGMILGDIGYGMVSLAAFLIMRRKLPNLRPLINILIISSISTIFFGFIFGEFFGYEAIMGHELPRLMNRLHETIQLLMIAIFVGVVHLNFGFILGFINEYRLHGFVRAMLEKGSWIVMELGAVLYYLSSRGYVDFMPQMGLGLIILGVIMLSRGEGIKGIVELPTLLSHTLSYARLMGAGLASVGLASVINNVAGLMFAKGGVYIAPAILIILFGHLMNVLLGLMEGFLHSLRLNYVEFFTKFYNGGGIPYVPFGGKKSGGGLNG